MRRQQQIKQLSINKSSLNISSSNRSSLNKFEQSRRSKDKLENTVIKKHQPLASPSMSNIQKQRLKYYNDMPKQQQGFTSDSLRQSFQNGIDKQETESTNKSFKTIEPREHGVK